MGQITWGPCLIVLVASGIGAITDVWRFRVYNALTFPLMMTGLLYHLSTGGLAGLGGSLSGFAFGFGILIVPHLLGLMGAGDVKLLAGVGAWLGFQNTLLVFVISSLTSGIYATVLVLYRGRLTETWGTMKLILYRFAALGAHFGKEDLVEPLMATVDRRLRVIPFGAMVPLGIVGAIVWSNWISF